MTRISVYYSESLIKVKKNECKKNLTGDWRKLILVNYVVDPLLLK